MLSNSLQILLIEDDLEDVELLQEYLEITNSIHYRLVHATTLREGLEYLKASHIRRSFGLILLDLSLPDKHGLGAVHTVYSVACDLPIVVLTGLDDETTALETLRQGAQDYLVKNTLNEVLLCCTIKSAIERKRLPSKLLIR